MARLNWGNLWAVLLDPPPSGLVHWGRAGEGRPSVIGTLVSSSMPGKSLRVRQSLYSQCEAMQLP